MFYVIMCSEASDFVCKMTHYGLAYPVNLLHLHFPHVGGRKMHIWVWASPGRLPRFIDQEVFGCLILPQGLFTPSHPARDRATPS